MLIQSSVNSFGSVAMAGNTAGSNVEGFVYTSMNSVHQTAVSFTGQNLGGKKYDRIDKVLAECLLFVTALFIVSAALWTFLLEVSEGWDMQLCP